MTSILWFIKSKAKFTLKEGGIPGIKWEKGQEATNEVLKEMKKTFGGKYYDAEYSLLKIGGGILFPCDCQAKYMAFNRKKESKRLNQRGLFVFTLTESKRFIAKAVANLSEVRKAKEDG